MRRFLKQFMANLRWRYAHWLCSVDGHKPRLRATDQAESYFALYVLACFPLISVPVCGVCGDHIEELDPVRQARLQRKASRRERKQAFRRLQ